MILTKINLIVLWVYGFFISRILIFLLDTLGLQRYLKLKRWDFEGQNRIDPASCSFTKIGKKAKVAFEVSSEGELEQIRPLMEELLERDSTCFVELIYCSPSVQNNISKLVLKYPQQLRVLRLPLLSYQYEGSEFCSVKKWMTAPSLILCRYDFFPELMLMGRLWGKTLFLMAATVKNHAPFDNFFKATYWKWIFESFSFIACSTEKDKLILQDLLCLSEKERVSESRLAVLELRILQIMKRLDPINRDEKLSHLPFMKSFKNKLSKFPREKRIIFGSFWAQEAALLDNKDFQEDLKKGHLLLVIAPHQLSQESLTQISHHLKSLVPEFPLFFIDAEDEIPSCEGGIIILKMKGILCELYSFFGHVYVGGGFGRSIHSVLEPYLANTHVYMGPKIHRSTEYDLIAECSPLEVHVLQKPQDFYSLYREEGRVKNHEENREKLVAKTHPLFTKFMLKFNHANS